MMRLAEALDVFVNNNYGDDQVELALDWATSAIQGYTGRSFDLVTGDVVLLDPHEGKAMLPNFPVVQITDVSAWLPASNSSGMTWTAITNYAFVPETGLVYNTTGLPGTSWHPGPSWPWLPGSLRVTYDHGYTAAPQPLRDVCIRLAQQYLDNPTLAMNSRVGEVEARYSGSSGLVMTHHDKAILDRYCDVGVS